MSYFCTKMCGSAGGGYTQPPVGFSTGGLAAFRRRSEMSMYRNQVRKKRFSSPCTSTRIFAESAGDAPSANTVNARPTGITLVPRHREVPRRRHRRLLASRHYDLDRVAPRGEL